MNQNEVSAIDADVQNNINIMNSQDLLSSDHIKYIENLKISPKIIYDIGSCVLHWERHAKRVWPDSEIYLFDANMDVKNLYDRTNQKYHLGILTDVDGKTVKFYEDPIKITGNSYYKENSSNYNENHGVHRVGATLDYIVEKNNWPKPDLIKLDVQGAETDILKGAINCLKNCSDIILESQHVEYNSGAPFSNEVIDFMKSIGFELVSNFSKQEVDGDYHFQKINEKNNIMNRTKIIQSLIDKVNAKSYLEIGVDNGINFQTINCNKKIGVDPNTNTIATYHETSDAFFEKNNETFDIIFIDGLHHADQVYKDILNSLKVLNDGGYIVCHDMNPLEESHQEIPFVSGAWNGDCWKAFVQLRCERSDLQMHVVNADHGCGIISKGKQSLLKLSNVPTEYKFFNIHRKEWLNLISVDEFRKTYLDQDALIIDVLLKNFIMHPNDPENNFLLARYYDELGQTASALSYYLRTAERTEDDLLRYECVLLGAACFERQGTRKFTMKGMLQQAVSILPKRPEGYYLLSRFYENNVNNEGRFLDSYMTASQAIVVCDFEDLIPLRTVNTINYPGKYCLLVQKAVVAWNCGMCDESRSIFLDLYSNYDMNEYFTTLVRNNLNNMGAFASKSLALYSKDKHNKLKVKFEGSENVEQNYAEAYQDMFVLTMHNGKKNGTYVEIGSGHPTYGNNSYLLEKDFGWRGVSLDISEEFVAAHNTERKHTCLLRDATTVNYDRFLNGLDMPTTIDYLQIDVDPADISYKVLLSMPLEKYKFGVITFEHDHYADPKSDVRSKSRKYLESYGYKLVAPNISPDDNRPYEDWYIHPELIDTSKIELFNEISDDTKKAEKYMFGEI